MHLLRKAVALFDREVVIVHCRMLAPLRSRSLICIKTRSQRRPTVKVLAKGGAS
jgi:hypothetical protein